MIGATEPALAPAAPAAAATSPARMHFRPGLWPTLLLLALLPLFLSLADWQWQKAERKSGAQSRRDQRGSEPPVSLPARRIADAADWQFRQVAARGEFLAAGQILLDNQVRHGSVGVSVLTPLRLEGGSTVVLVDRGWLPLAGDRSAMPHPEVPAGTVSLVGTAILPADRFFRLGAETAAAGKDAVWQHLDLARYRELSNLSLQPLILRLSPDSAHGFLREWPRPDDRHERHRSYALQWLGFAIAAVMIWLWNALRRPTSKTGRQSP